jgi:hypothetical protein
MEFKVASRKLADFVRTQVLIFSHKLDDAADRQACEDFAEDLRDAVLRKVYDIGRTPTHRNKSKP